MDMFNRDFNEYVTTFKLAQAHSGINLDSILVDTLQLMQPASKPAGESARMRGESDECGKEVQLARVTTGHVGITSSSSH